MSKEQGILTKKNSEIILRKIDRSFFKGSFSKLGSGASRKVDENMPAMVAMHESNAIATGHSVPVSQMEKAIELVDRAEKEYVAKQAVLQKGGQSR